MTLTHMERGKRKKKRPFCMKRWKRERRVVMPHRESKHTERKKKLDPFVPPLFPLLTSLQ